MVFDKALSLASGMSAIAIVLTASPAEAQTNQPDDSNIGEPEIVVTAQKRATNLQETAAAISVADGEALREQQVTSIEGLAQTLPSVNFGQTTGNARIAIRGIGFDNTTVGNEGRVAYHVDGVYLSRPASVLAGFYDVERVEILRGPQGTLYGRNATGGAINVISRAPGKTMNGYFDATYGNYDLKKFEGAFGGPVSSVLSARFSFQAIDRDGYGRNLTNGRDVDDQSTIAVRGQLRFEPSDTFDLTLSGDYFYQDDHAYSFRYLGRGSLTDLSSTPPLPGQQLTGIRAGGVVPANLRDSTSDSGPDNRRRFWGLAANARFDMGWAEFLSITGYRSSSFNVTSDLDVTSARLTVYDQFEYSDQFSQELRLAGDYSRGDWMIGGYYFDESIFGGTRIPLDLVVLSRAPTLPPLSFLRQGYYGVGLLDTRAYALFGSARFELSDQFAVRLGARYSDETRKIDEVLKFDFATPFPPFVPQFPPTPPGVRRQLEESFSSFTPSATLEYKPSEDLFLYATYAKGFKSGGFNLGVIQPPFAPEKITDYEAGIRADWLNGRLRTNISAFYYDYTNLQVTKIAGTVVTIENAANAVVRGIEAEIVVRPISRLRLDAAISLLDSEYRNYSTTDPARPALGVVEISGNDLSQAPSYTINVNASYTLPTDVGDFTLRGEGRWVDRVYFTQFNLDHVSQPAYSLFNAFLSWESRTSGLRATAFIRNIGNKDIVSAGFIGSSLVGSPLLGSFEPPRTYGLTLGWTF